MTRFDTAAAKSANRIVKERERLAANRSRSAPDASRETRQQVRQEGRELEARMAARKASEARAAKQKNRPRKTESSEAFRTARKLSRGWFKRHESKHGKPAA